MDKLRTVIQNLEKSEYLRVKSFVKSSVNKDNSKLEKVFELMYQGYSSEKIGQLIYGSYPNSGYYALRKRLYYLILNYIAYEKNKELNNEENDIQLFFVAGKNLILNKSYKLGFECLGKALEKAKKNEFNAATIEILMELIQVAHLNSSINLQTLINDFEKYKDLQHKQNIISIAYAEVKQKMNYFFLNSIKSSALKEIEEVFKKYELSIEKDLNYRTLYQLGQLSLAKSTVTKSFVKELIDFEAKIKNIFQSKEPKNSNQWIFKLKLLYLLASSNYRAKRFTKSNLYINQIIKSTNSINVAISKEFYFKVIVLKTLNTNYLGRNEEAFTILDKLLSTSKLVKINKNWLDGYGVLSLILFHGSKYKDILKLYSSRYRKSDLYYLKANGLEWVMRKNLILILTLYELGKIEEAEKTLNDFKTEYQVFLKKNQRVFFFLMCIEKVISNPFQVKNFHFHKFVESKLEKKPRYEEDIFVLSFFAWLKSKMFEENIYKTTIDIVRNLEVIT